MDDSGNRFHMIRGFRSEKKRILVVDDEQQVCDILAEALVHLGHHVETAMDGIEAIEKTGRGTPRVPFDVVITDLDMPRMDGMELIKYLADHHKGIDIIAITGHAMRYQYTDVIAAGASDFIAKPFSINELQAKLNRIFRERYLMEELERLAVRDPLTGLYNRRVFDEVARREAVRALRYHQPLFMFFLDVDRFKEYNDTFGHQAGDNLLVELASLLSLSVRDNVDTVFRFGGDEFTILFPHLMPDQALKVAERIRERYNKLELEPTHLSIGIAHFKVKSGDVGKDIEDMMLRSDKALYHAKRELGGNQAYLSNDTQ